MRAVTNTGYCPQGFVRFSAVELECLVRMGIREEIEQESESFRISLRWVIVGNAVRLPERSADEKVNVRELSPLRR